MATKVYLIINAGDRAGEKNVCKLKSFSEQSVEEKIFRSFVSTLKTERKNGF